MEVKININEEMIEGSDQEGQEEIRAAISFLRAEMEETIKHRLEEVLVFLDRRTVGLRERAQREDRGNAVGTTSSYDRIQVKTQAMKTLVETTQHGLKTELAGQGRFPPGTRQQSARFQDAAGGSLGQGLAP
jgi:hypothetical protein